MHDRRGARRRRRAPVALALLLLAPACGDDPDPTPAEVAAGVCAASIRWRDDLGDLVEELSRAGVGEDDVGRRKALLVGFVEDGRARTDGLVEDVRDAGVDGPAEAALVAGADEIRAVWDEALALAEGFPDEQDDESFPFRGIQLVHYSEQTAAVWKSALQEARVAGDPALTQALAEEPTCEVIPRTADTVGEAG